MKRITVLAVLATLVVTACQDMPTQHGLEGIAPLASISDAVHEHGNLHFFFLPPMVPQPAHAGKFDGSLEPVVEICVGHSSQCDQTVATYTMETGPGSETVRVVPEDEHYIVNWHTDLVDPGDYRIRVLVRTNLADTELGYADVVLDSNKELKNVETDEYVPLKDGRTLPIKFRIEEGALGIITTQTIVFHSNRGGNFDIYAMDDDGGNVVQLTDNPGSDAHPAWSPDGTKIAFRSDRDGNIEVYILDLSTMTESRFTNHPATDWEARWSPDGSMMTFRSNRTGAAQDVWRVNADGTNLINLTNGYPGRSNGNASWSADGTKIVFASTGSSGDNDVYTMNADGTGVTNLTSGSSGSDMRTEWSPDGNKILFASARVNGEWALDLFVMNTDGSNVVQLTNGSNTNDENSCWLADGSRIVFGRHADIWIMNADGSGQVNITNDPSADGSPQCKHAMF